MGARGSWDEDKEEEEGRMVSDLVFVYVYHFVNWQLLLVVCDEKCFSSCSSIWRGQRMNTCIHVDGCAWRCRCCFLALERELEIESSRTADTLMAIR